MLMKMISWQLVFMSLLLLFNARRVENTDFLSFRQCEPIRIEMCRHNGYNETSMPNLLGMELQSDVEFTLQTFAPLIEFVCSTQLKLFLCAAYVPMCTQKVSQAIGPCRSLCESVRSRCQPVLTGFGFPWPPALDCALFPKENNHETMCMEGPGEVHLDSQDQDIYSMTGLIDPKVNTQGNTFDCPGIAKSHLYVKLHRSGRCAPLCEADVLFGQHEKHLSEAWVTTWTYAAFSLGVIATTCIFFSDDSKNSSKWSCMLTSLVWCHVMVATGWTVRFVSGRIATACGYDPQIPNVSLLLIDGLSNASCAATFILRYYFGMASCVWWAILCLGWNREIRRNNIDTIDPISPDITYSRAQYQKTTRIATKKGNINITQSNLARFVAWGLPAFQTAAVIVAQLVDADELLGACFVGNQSDKGLQILVATPLFCYWIFGSMNLISGYLVHRRSNEDLRTKNLRGMELIPKANQSGIGTFLSIYCVPYTLLLFAVIYEFANIDVWLNVPLYVTALEGITTPMWPFLTRAFMELMLGPICFAWVLGPKISTTYRRRLSPCQHKNKTNHAQPTQSNRAYSPVSYQTVCQTPHQFSAIISMNQVSNCSMERSAKLYPSTKTHIYVNQPRYKQSQTLLQNQFKKPGNETIL